MPWLFVICIMIEQIEPQSTNLPGNIVPLYFHKAAVLENTPWVVKAKLLEKVTSGFEL